MLTAAATTRSRVALLRAMMSVMMNNDDTADITTNCSAADQQQ
jgi:hypothetical protein